MKKYFKIISNEPKFDKMLSLELSDIGLVRLNDSNDDIEKENLFTVIDLDFCTEGEIRESAKCSTVIGYTKKSENINEYCSVIFQRPFFISDFVKYFGEYEAPKTPAFQKRKDKYKKPTFLTIEDGCAIWGETKISLSENEHKVLKLLCDNRGEIVEREQIYSLLGAEEGNMGDVYICHLRKKIDNKLGLKLIYTIRGKGYMLKN